MNRGDGTFGEPGARSGCRRSGLVRLLDYDNDGFLDALLLPPAGPPRSGATTGRAGCSGPPSEPFRRRSRPNPWTSTATAIWISCSSRRRAARRSMRTRAATPTDGSTSLLEGLPTGSAKVNRFGFGSDVELKAQELYVYRVAWRPVTRLGLGARRRADVLRIVWTNGIPQNALDPKARTVLREVQQLKGSCPFLYAFDGARWHFVTDVLGRAPAGLLYDGVHQAPADTREWLVVPGGSARAARRPSRARLHRGALGSGVLRSRRALRRRSSGGRRPRGQREDGAAALSGEDALHGGRARACPGPSTARARPHRRDRGGGRPLPGRLRAHALPGHRRAARPRPRAPGGAPRRAGDALPHRLDPVRRHFDQRLALSASAGSGALRSGARSSGRERRLEDRDRADGLSGRQDEDHARRPFERPRPRRPARADPHQPRHLLGPHRLHGRRCAGAGAADAGALEVGRALLSRILEDDARA